MARASRLPASERRRRIIEAARYVFARSSYAAVSTVDLAKAAGVSEAALYRYFPSKRDLYLATLGSARVRLQEIWQRLAAEVDDPVETVRGVALGYYDHVRSHSDFVRLQFRALSESDDPDVQEAVRENFGGLAQFLADALREGQRRGFIRENIDAAAVAWQILGMGLAMDVVHLLGFDQQVDRRRAEEWTELFLGALRPDAPSRPTVRIVGSAHGLPLWQPLGRDVPGVVEVSMPAAEGE